MARNANHISRNIGSFERKHWFQTPIACNLTSPMSLIPASRHLSRKIGPLASQVAKRWISVQRLDDQQAGGSECHFWVPNGCGRRSAERYALTALYSHSRVSICTIGRVFRNAISNERNLRVLGEFSECGSHNYSAALCIQCLIWTDDIVICRSHASRCAWHRMGRILASSKPSRSTISACCHLSKTLLCFYASPRFYECRNSRAPNCLRECSRS